MTEAQKKCLDKLKAQTAGQSGTVNMCGRQIWDIVKSNPELAELVSTDLDNPSMTVRCCERKIREAADEKHKKEKGSSACVSPDETENIIRKFYGLPPRAGAQDDWETEETPEQPAEPPKPAADPGIISLEDFL